MNDLAMAIVSAFFIIGIAVGIIAVVAMSVLRARAGRAMPTTLSAAGSPSPGGRCCPASRKRGRGAG